LLIVAASTAHDFLPHNWDTYAPTWVEISITIGSFTFFLFWFFAFSRLLPTVPLSDVKEDTEKDRGSHAEPDISSRHTLDVRHSQQGVLGVFRQPEELLTAVQEVEKSSFDRIETYSPMRLRKTEAVMGRGASPVRFWTLVGALSGLVGGFALAIGTAKVNSLIVGGKPPVSIIPYCVVGFEGTILLGTIANLIGMLIHSRLGKPKVPVWYDSRFSRDRFGLFVACIPEKFDAVKTILSSSNAEDIHAFQ
jgi:hypothetical protein